MRKWSFAVFALMALGSAEARADVLVRIGDVDGFGYGTAPGFHGANGSLSNADGVGVLTNGDLLPDINRDGKTQTGSHDDFDLRSTSEVNNTEVTAGVGVTSTSGTTGSKYTDISLSTSYGVSSAANRVLIGGNPNAGLVFGAGGPFPDGSPATLPNQPGFVFDFQADLSRLDPKAPIFFNLIFGDFDVVPATVTITRADNTTRTVNVRRQPNNEDGLIQAATATLGFGDVFNSSGHGFLKVDFNAPNEPYTAFDFVELNTTALVNTVPEPATIVGCGTGLAALGLVGAWRRFRSKAGPRPSAG